MDSVLLYVSWWVVCHYLLNLLHYEQRQFFLRATLGSKQWLTSTICLFATTSLCTNILTEDIRAPNRMQNFLWCFFHSLIISWQVTKLFLSGSSSPFTLFNFFRLFLSKIFNRVNTLLRKSCRDISSVQIYFLCCLIPKQRAWEWRLEIKKIPNLLDRSSAYL